MQKLTRVVGRAPLTLRRLARTGLATIGAWALAVSAGCGEGSSSSPGPDAPFTAAGASGESGGSAGGASGSHAGQSAQGGSGVAGSGGGGSSNLGGNGGGAGVAGGCTPNEPPQSAEDVASGLEFYSAPEYMARSTQYSVTINGTPVDVIGDLKEFDYVHFSMWGLSATIEVTAKDVTSITKYSISPLKKGFSGSVNGNKLTYSLPIDQYTIVYIEGQSKRLIVAADPRVIAPPTQGAGIYNIVLDHGADPTGNEWATEAVQAAIDRASSDACGRGTVFVPPGKYKLGNIRLKSNVTLYMTGGAAFWFSGERADYREDWTNKGNGTRWIETEDGAHDIKIYGRGTIDGNALNSKSFFNNMLVLRNAENVEVDGIVLRAGSRWGTMIVRSNDVLFNNVKFLQGFESGENDGVDVIESQDVHIKFSIAVSGDDPFSVKSYDYEEQYLVSSDPPAHEPARNITFDSLIAWTGCHAFKIGQGVGQTQENITFKHSVVYRAAHAVSLHHKAGAAEARNITWENIDVESLGPVNIGESWAFLYIEGKSGVGSVRDLTIRNINVRDTGSGIWQNKDWPLTTDTDMSPVYGFDESHQIRDVLFKNIVVSGAKATTLKQAHLQLNDFAQNVRIEP